MVNIGFEKNFIKRYFEIFLRRSLYLKKKIITLISNLKSRSQMSGLNEKNAGLKITPPVR